MTHMDGQTPCQTGCRLPVGRIAHFLMITGFQGRCKALRPLPMRQMGGWYGLAPAILAGDRERVRFQRGSRAYSTALQRIPTEAVGSRGNPVTLSRAAAFPGRRGIARIGRSGLETPRHAGAGDLGSGRRGFVQQVQRRLHWRADHGHPPDSPGTRQGRATETSRSEPSKGRKKKVAGCTRLRRNPVTVSSPAGVTAN